MMDSLWQDIRYAARSLRRTPDFTAAAVITLALGIGANTAAFSVVDAVILRPLAYTNPERLVVIHDTVPRLGRFPVGPNEFEEWRRSARSFEQMALLAIAPVNLTGPENPERLDGARVSPQLFSMLGIAPALGRSFSPGEDVAGRDHVVVLSDELWRRRFGADPAVIGRRITVNDEPFTVVGVLPRSFRFPRLEQLYAMPIASGRPQLWMPFAIREEERGENSFACVALLRSDVSISQARTELNAIQRSFGARFSPRLELGADILTLQAQITGTSRDSLTLLWAAVGLVLVIACGNVASLFLTRNLNRRRELAVRSAIGASPGDLLRQTVVETLLLAGIGGLCGILVANVCVPLILLAAPVSVPRLDEVVIDGRTLAFAAIVTTLTGLVIGLLPGWRASGANPLGGIGAQLRGASAGKGQRGFPNVVVAGQVALTIVCLAATGLLLQSFANVLSVDSGFDGRQLLGVDVSVPGSRYPDLPKRAQYVGLVLERLQGLNRVTSVGVTNRLPLNGTGTNSVIVEEGTEEAPIPMQERPLGDIRSVNSDYFRTLGIPLLNGQLFSETDVNRNVALVSAATASRAWPRQNPVGKRFRLTAAPGRLIEVIGVVGNVRGMGLDKDPSLAVYLPYWQGFLNNVSFAIKTSGDAAAIASEIRSAIRAVDASVPIFAFRTMEQIVGDSVAPRRFETLLVTLFAAIAILLSAFGIYGVLSHAVTQRTREMGVRLALGARPAVVHWMVLRDALRLVVAGLVIGVSAAIAVGFMLRTLLFGVEPQNLVTLVGACSLLTAVAMLAAFVPARRAASVDPMIAIRSE